MMRLRGISLYKQHPGGHQTRHNRHWNNASSTKLADTGEHNQMVKALQMHRLPDGIGQDDGISGQYFLRHNLNV